MKKYLITGGEGFIGGHIVERVKGEAFDIKSGKDVLNLEDLEKAVAGCDGIFHCAAKISVPESFQMKDEYYRNNVLGTQAVVAAAKGAGVPVVFASSAAVYGNSVESVTEFSALVPLSPYAENKRDAEVLLADSGIPAVALRFFNVYGPKQSKEYAGVVTAFIHNALSGSDLVIYGDGSQVRDFVFIDDIVGANIAAMNFLHENPKSGYEVFNVATGVQTTIDQLAKMIIEITGSASKITYALPREGDIAFSAADVTAAKNTLSFEASVKLRDGLQKTIEAFK